MNGKLESRVLKSLKKASENEVKNTIDTRCIWWCYEPKIPKALEMKIHKKSAKTSF